MARNATPADLIVESSARHPGCSLDGSVTCCHELTLNQKRGDSEETITEKTRRGGR